MESFEINMFSKLTFLVLVHLCNLVEVWSVKFPDLSNYLLIFSLE